ncbi:MAG TPA: hypothetical protein VFD58_25065 [Blastocatellia bacterium]|nr:hypothetical protein [Blastocatellia bacterium]
MKIRKHGRSIRIIFLGQCIAAGYGIDDVNAYPKLVCRLLAAQFPGLSFQPDFRPLLHPVGLKALLRSCLSSAPDIIFISLPAIFASVPFRLNSLYLAAPDVMNLARSFVRKIEASVRKDSALARAFRKRSAFVPTVVCAPVSPDEYERLVEDAVRFCQQTSACRVVLMGPGGFNVDTGNEELKSPEMCSVINQAILRVGGRLDVPVINAHDWMTDQGGKVFSPGNHRWNQLGHEIMAREIQAVIGAEVRGPGA